MSESQALVPVERDESPNLPAVYRAPRPGRSWRSAARFSVLVGGSAAIGVGVALGSFGVGAAALMAVGLATAQVVAQTFRQNRLGQDVVGGIAGGDLDQALVAAERALAESPSGVMRTLAASNLASVLIQLDRVEDAADVLDQYPPGILHMPLATVLWLNNRAFAALALGDEAGEAVDPAKLLDEAERRLARASPRDLGGPHNAKKLASAVAGTRAIERVQAGDAKTALACLERAKELDDGMGTPFRTAERELCRAEALRLAGRKDEAVLVVAALEDAPMTARQRERFAKVAGKLDL